MWAILRGHRLEGWKFTRQVSVGPYFVDFAARREKLAIELDGYTHSEQGNYDLERTRYLNERGWQVIRFTNSDIVANPDGVAMMILQALPQKRGPSPQPSPRRGEGA